MLTEIGSKDRILEFIERAKNKDDPFRLMGFGHRVYKNYDPRAKVMQKSCHAVLGAPGIEHDPLLEIAVEYRKSVGEGKSVSVRVELGGVGLMKKKNKKRKK